MSQQNKQIASRVSSVIIAFITFAVLGIALWATPELAVSQFEEKKRKANTLLMYDMNVGDSLRFTVLPTDDLFYVVSHSQMPATYKYDPDKTVEYGFTAVMYDLAGKTRRTQEYFERSRQSKAIETKQGWLEENSFLPPGHGELSDDRITAITTGNYLSNGGDIELTLSAGSHPVLFRIYRIKTRTDLQRLRRYHQMPEFRKDTLATYMGLDDLDELSMGDLWNLFQRKWERVEATTSAGDPLTTQRMYHSGFRLPPRAHDESIIHLSSFQKSAFNMIGPMIVDVSAVADQQSVTLEASVINESSELPPSPQPTRFEMSDGKVVPISIPAGLHTLVIENVTHSKPVLFRVGMKKSPGILVGSMNLVPDPTKRWKHFLNPDSISFELFLAEKSNDEVLEYSTVSFDKEDVVRLDVRAVLKSYLDSVPREFVITYFDSANLPVSTIRSKIKTDVAPFERGLEKSSEYGVWLSEVHRIYLAPPPNAHKLRISSDHDLGVRMFVRHEISQDEEILFYPEESLVDRRWRYRKIIDETWFEIHPLQWKELRKFGLSMIMRAMARLQTVEPNPPPDDPSWGSVLPINTKNQEMLLSELNIDPKQPTKYSDTSTLRVSCPAGRKAFLDLIPDPVGPGRGICDLLYFIPQNVPLDGGIAIHKGGRSLTEFIPTTRQSTLRVRRIPRKVELSWSHTFSEGKPRVFVATRPTTQNVPPPPAGCKLYRTYTTTRIPPGSKKDFQAVKQAGLATSVNVISYSESLPKMQILIDHGSPRHHSGAISDKYTKSFHEPESVAQEDFDDVWMPRRPHLKTRPFVPFAFGLQNDLTTGKHTITLFNKGSKPIWVRLFQNLATKSTTSRVNVKSVR